MSYKLLQKTFYRLSQLSHAGSFLNWDQQVMMPSKSNASRGRALAELMVISTEIIQSPDLADAFDDAENETGLESWQETNLSRMREVWLKANAVPKDLVEALAIKTIECEHAWRDLRKQNNWTDFEPLLAEVFNLCRQRGQALADGLSREKGFCNEYEALVDQYDPGTCLNTIDEVFNGLKSEIPGILQSVLEKQSLQKPPLRQSSEVEKIKQIALARNVMTVLGFDFDAGRLDEAAHPFSGGTSDDSRITTRYSGGNVIEGLMGIIHETGHSRYETGLPEAWRNQPVGESMGMSVHESQSLFFEMQMGRSDAFIRAIAPMLRQHLGADPAFQPENLFRIYRHVEPGLIRVNADEVTYPLHVILRYEIERDVILQQADVRDIPELWNEGMKQLLGLDTTGNFADGPMQDIHWPGGAVGYFPSYTLGALTAAQLFSSMTRAIPDAAKQIERLEFSPVFNWLSENIWSKASSLTYDDLIVEATGEKLNPAYFVDHLKARYL